MPNERPAPDITRLPIRRNVAPLSAAVAANAAMLDNRLPREDAMHRHLRMILAHADLRAAR